MGRSTPRSMPIRLLASLICALIATPATLASADDATSRTFVDVSGASRFHTAVEASRLAYPDGASSVVIATGLNWPDALSSMALAGVIDAPILLVTADSIPAVVEGEIARLGATHAIIVGGTVAVGEPIASSLRSLGISVERISGASRYETADAVALRVISELEDGFDGTVLVASGCTYADSIAGAPLAAAKGWPILLSHPTDGLSTVTAAALEDVKAALLLGGERRLAREVQEGLAERLGEGNVNRIAGATRYETAAAIAEYGVESAGLSWDGVGIATGRSYPDALVRGVLQARSEGVVLLTHPERLDPAARTMLEANREAITTVTFCGGEGALSRPVRTAVRRALESAPPDDEARTIEGAVDFADRSLGEAVCSSLEKPLGDLTPADIANVTRLRAWCGEISDLADLEHAVNLEWLELDVNELSDISALASFRGLSTLYLSHNRVSDASPLSELRNLSALDLSDNRIVDVSPLSGLGRMERLYLCGNEISDISPLSGLAHLSSLGLSRNRLVDIGPLSGLGNVWSLDLSGNQITDLSPLVANPGLGDGDYVDLSGNPLDITEGSRNMNDIAALRARGVIVEY